MEEDFADFERQFADFDETEATSGDVDVKTLDAKALVDIICHANRTLIEARQALDPTEQWARDLQSLREAARVELQLRTS